MSHRCGEVNLATRFRWKWGGNWRDLINTKGWWGKIRCCIFGFGGVDDFESVVVDVVVGMFHDLEERLFVVIEIFVVHYDGEDRRSDKLSLLGYWPPIVVIVKMMKTRVGIKK